MPDSRSNTDQALEGKNMKSVLAVIIILLFAGLFSCEKENTSPQASFFINPATGDDETIFLFDASACSDMEDPVEVLLIRWDWDGDDNFDTQYSTKKTADHIFTEAGEYLVKLMVKDTRGLTDTLQQALMVTSSNYPPGIPVNPSPVNEISNLGVNLFLSWECIDPDGDYLLYTVYFGTNSSPEKYLSNHAQNSFNPGRLEYGTTYFWRIDARDSEGNTTEGEVWNFSTIDLNFSTLTDSRDAQIYSTIEIGSKWWMAENLNLEIDDSYCYDEDSESCNSYGRLYSWDAAINACPDGWHLPSKSEFEDLIEFLGGSDVAGGKLKDYENNKWRSPNAGAVNTSGFGAMPAGMRYGEDVYSGQNYYAHFFTSTEFDEGEAFSVMLAYDYKKTFIYNYKKKYAVSIRCVQD